MSSSSLTYHFTQRDADKLKRLLRRKAANEDIKEALQRLDRLTQDEVRSVASQALGFVTREQTHSTFDPMSTEYPSLDVPEDTSSTHVSDTKAVPCLTNSSARNLTQYGKRP